MTRRIFRATALQRYNARLDRITLPRYARPPWVLLLWAICVSLLVATALLWTARIPVYTAGPAVIITAPAGPPDSPHVVVAAFLPPDADLPVRAHQPVRLHFSWQDELGWQDGITSQVASVEPELLAPARARVKYGLDASTGLLIDGPVVVALIPLAEPAAPLLGSVGEAQIEVGAMRVLALLPGIGRLIRAEGAG